MNVHESEGLLRLRISNLETPTAGIGGITRCRPLCTHRTVAFFLRLLFGQNVDGSILRALMAYVGNQGTHMGVDTI
jgi:hypothetical protein